MDFIKKFTEGENKPAGEQPTTQQQGESGGSFLDKAKNLANEQGGGGQKGEAKEDYLDKGIDMFQEKVLKQGPQDNESAAEQFKDEHISDFIRDNYKKQTGKDFPVADKE
ncbi:hypothetical protein ABW21_db0208830 [Orbilia brochopaga]|nr:hypothetical protein ABW21_db0208830 [Drechslerella brochopaga]